MGFGAGNPVSSTFARILKADLNVIETGLDQRLQALIIEPKTRGNEVRVESGGAGGGDELGEIGARQRFTSGEVRVQHAEFAALIEDADPVSRRKLRTRGGKLQGIRAVDAVQRAAMRDFGDEGERIGSHWSDTASLIAARPPIQRAIRG